VNTFSKDRGTELAMHPTVKPLALVADAIVLLTGDFSGFCSCCEST
jgi:hypothetical protein